MQPLQLHSAGDLQRLEFNVVGFSDEYQRKNHQLKSFLYQNMYQHHRVVRMQTKAERILEDLFGAYVQNPEILPSEVQQRARAGELHRTICDYIAGMTDRFAQEEHSKLFDPLIRP
jgi:dGTPase